MSHWRVSHRAIGMISPLALAGVALVAVISPDSPLPITIVVGLFVLALCYSLARIVDDIKAAADEARQHRETMAQQIRGDICHEWLSWLGAFDHKVKRFEAAAGVLAETYPDTGTYGPPSDGLRLRAVRDTGRSAGRISPSA